MRGTEMAGKKVTPWLIVSMAISLAAFASGFASGFAGGIPVGGHLISSPAFLPISFVLSIVWFLITIVAVVVHRWRGLWLLFGAPGALFWPTILMLFVLAIGNCMANHPGVQWGGQCLP
jgi:hypothetical protein